MYKIEELVDTFYKHAKESEERDKNILEDFIKFYPGEAIPSYMTKEFNVAFAFHIMCKEIMDLKRLKEG